MTNFFKKLIKNYFADKVPVQAAALSFYAIFAAAPIGLVSVLIVQALLDGGEAQSYLYDFLQRRFGGSAASTILDGANAVFGDEPQLWPSLVAGFTMLLGVVFFFLELQSSINQIWGIEQKQDRKWIYRSRELSISIFGGFSIGLILLVKLVGASVISALGDELSRYFFQIPGIFLNLAELALSVVLFTSLLVVSIQFLVKVKLPWLRAFEAAAITSLFYIVGEQLMSFYLGRSLPATIYGASGAVIVFILWVYYSTQIFLFGMEYLKLRMLMGGTQIEPTESAKIKNNLRGA